MPTSLDPYDLPPIGIPGLDDPPSQDPRVLVGQRYARERADEQAKRDAAKQQMDIQRQQAQQSAAQEKRQQADYDRAERQRANPAAPQIPGMTAKSATVSDDGKVNYQFSPATGDEYVPYESLAPEEQAMVDQIASGRVPFPARGGFKPDKLLRIKGALASKYGPDSEHPYSAAEYPARQAAKIAFSAGPEGRARQSINTVIMHLSGLKDAGDKMANTNVLPVWNKVTNYVGEKTSADIQSHIKVFNGKADAVASELGKVYGGSQPAMALIKEWRKGLDEDASPKAQNAAIESAIEMLAGRMYSLQDQWDRTVKEPRTEPFLNKENRALLDDLQKRGIVGANHMALDPVVEEGRPGAGTPPAALNAAPAPAAAPQQPAAQLSPEDQAAITWANANPNDPRAARIKQLHGIR